MTILESFKKEIAQATGPMEILGILDGLHCDAKMYCFEHHKEEMIRDKEGNIQDVSINGMCKYLSSEDPRVNR